MSEGARQRTFARAPAPAPTVRPAAARVSHGPQHRGEPSVARRGDARFAEAATLIRRRGLARDAAGPGPAPAPAGSGGVRAFFAERAHHLPGFRLLAIALGTNPIDGGRVDRSAANVLRAVVELVPGGGLIAQALERYGVLDRAGRWIEQQLAALGISGASIRAAIDRFLESLSWRDVFDPGGVWDRARGIFADPIDRVLRLAGALGAELVRIVQEAILRPLADLASRTRGWDLLCAVLGRNPITGEPVPRNAEALIGGFLRLIGQEELWRNIVRANAVARAWAWFQGALAGLAGLAARIPQLFTGALRALELADLLDLPRAFLRIGRAFGDLAGDFARWAGGAAWTLLEIVFSAVAPGVMAYLQRARDALRNILRDPIGFAGNLVRAGVQGFRSFAGNFVQHLRAALVGWLAGALAGANVYIPQGLAPRELVRFVLSVLGLTWHDVRARLVRAAGEPAVRVLETTFDLVVRLVAEGPAAAWEQLRDHLANLRELVIEQLLAFVRDRIVTAAVTRLIASLNPAGAFLQAILAIHNTIMFFVERMRQLADFVRNAIDALHPISIGDVARAAAAMERGLVQGLTLVISFLARLVGLGRASDAVTGVIARVRQPIDRALDRVVDRIVARARPKLEPEPRAGALERYRLEGMVATYAEMPREVGDQLTPDHQPQAELLWRVSNLPAFAGTLLRGIAGRSRSQHVPGGMSINLHERRHVLTRTYGARGAATADAAWDRIRARVAAAGRDEEAQRTAAVDVLRREAQADAEHVLDRILPQPATGPAWSDLGPGNAPVIERIRAQIRAGIARIRAQRFDRFKQPA